MPVHDLLLFKFEEDKHKNVYFSKNFLLLPPHRGLIAHLR